MANEKVRVIASTGRSSSIGQRRATIYRGVWEKVSHAKACKCWLEVITLVESVIADRLEARFAFLHDQRPRSRLVRTASQTAQLLSKESTETDLIAHEIYQRIIEWSKSRNSSLHELAKLIENNNGAWESRYEEAEKTAIEGEKIARSISLNNSSPISGRGVAGLSARA